MNTQINQPLTQAQAWRTLQRIAKEPLHNPALVDCPDWRASFKQAHAAWEPLFLRAVS